MTSTLSFVLALIACSCSVPKQPEPKPVSPRFSTIRLDGGLLTRYAPHARELTEVVPGTATRRSFIILNDPACPVEISAFGLTMNPDLSLKYNSSFRESCTPEKQLANDFECARLMFSIDWSFKAKSPVAAWEAMSFAFDAFNRFLWTNGFANGTRGKDATGLELAMTYKTGRLWWWDTDRTDNLGKWITSIVFMTSVRAKDGTVWTCDKNALKDQIKALSLDPSELK